MTPRDTMRRADATRKEAVDLERDAILAALEQAEWFVARAACALWPDAEKHAANMRLVNMLRGRHAGIGEMVRERHAAGGYVTGRPRRS